LGEGKRLSLRNGEYAEGGDPHSDKGRAEEKKHVRQLSIKKIGKYSCVCKEELSLTIFREKFGSTKGGWIGKYSNREPFINRTVGATYGRGSDHHPMSSGRNTGQPIINKTSPGSKKVLRKKKAYTKETGLRAKGRVRGLLCVLAKKGGRVGEEGGRQSRVVS